MNFIFKEVLEALTGKPYSPDVYQMVEPIVTESELVLERRDKQEIVLNTSVRDLLRSECPDANIPDLLYGTECAALGFEGPDMETGAVRVDIYLPRDDNPLRIVRINCLNRGKTISANNAVIHCQGAMDREVKNFFTNYARIYRQSDLYRKLKDIGMDFTEKREEEPSSSCDDVVVNRNNADDDLPPTTPRVKRSATTPVCRIEAEALGDGIVDGKEDVDWHTEILEDSGNRLFWPARKGGKLVLRCDFSAIHPDLKPGFEFDGLTVSEHKELEIRIGRLKIEKLYTLKLKAMEFVAGSSNPEKEGMKSLFDFINVAV